MLGWNHVPSMQKGVHEGSKIWEKEKGEHGQK